MFYSLLRAFALALPLHPCVRLSAHPHDRGLSIPCSLALRLSVPHCFAKQRKLEKGNRSRSRRAEGKRGKEERRSKEASEEKREKKENAMISSSDAALRSSRLVL
ncbi:hypothetical protein IWX48DRAFT_325962 [Phyllosticta citricarpa]